MPNIEFPAEIYPLEGKGVIFTWMPRHGPTKMRYPEQHLYEYVTPAMETLDLPAIMFTQDGFIEQGEFRLAVRPETLPEPPDLDDPEPDGPEPVTDDL